MLRFLKLNPMLIRLKESFLIKKPETKKKNRIGSTYFFFFLPLAKENLNLHENQICGSRESKKNTFFHFHESKKTLFFLSANQICNSHEKKHIFRAKFFFEVFSPKPRKSWAKTEKPIKHLKRGQINRKKQSPKGAPTIRHVARTESMPSDELLANKNDPCGTPTKEYLLISFDWMHGS